MRVTVLILFASLLVGCGASNPFKSSSEVDIRYKPIPYPKQLNIAAVKPINKGTHWEITHNDYIELRNWVIEFERWMEDARGTINYLVESIETYRRETGLATVPDRDSSRSKPDSGGSTP